MKTIIEHKATNGYILNTHTLHNYQRIAAVIETTQKVSASTGTLGNRRLGEDTPKVLAIGCGGDLSG